MILLKNILNYDRNFLLSSFCKIIVFLQKEVSFELSVIFINNITKICFYFLFFRDSDFTLQYFACFTYSKKRHQKKQLEELLLKYTLDETIIQNVVIFIQLSF